MPVRTGVINAVAPRRSLEDRGYLGMLLTAVSETWWQSWRREDAARELEWASNGVLIGGMQAIVPESMPTFFNAEEYGS